MPRTCTICTHPERSSIDASFVAGTPYRSIAKQFGASEAAMYRHTAEHIQQAIQQTQIAKEEAQSIDVIKQLKTINAVTIAILNEARIGKMHSLALSAIDRVQKQIELQAKLLGDIDKQPPQEQDGLVIPYDHISARARMEIQRILMEDERRKERAS